MEIRDFYWGWEYLERRLGSGLQIVDSDLMGGTLLEPHTPKFLDRDHALRELQTIQSTVSRSAPSDFINKEFVEMKLRGSETILRYLLGESISFRDFIYSTMGIIPHSFEESFWAGKSEELNDLINQLDPKKKGICIDSIFMSDPKELKHLLPRAADQWIKKLTTSLGVTVSLSFQIDFVEKDAYWISWFSAMNDNSFKLTMNVHPGRRLWVHDEHFWAAHEIAGHAAHFTCLKESVKRGSADEIGLLVTNHDMFMFQCEAVAQSVLSLIGSDDSSVVDCQQLRYLKARDMYFYLILGLMNEAQMMMDAGVSIDEAADYVQKFHPFYSRDTILADLKDRVSNPIMRCYQFVYHPSFELFNRLSRLDKISRYKLLSRFYREFFTPNQLIQLINNALA